VSSNGLTTPLDTEGQAPIFGPPKAMSYRMKDHHAATANNFCKDGHIFIN